MAIHLSQPPKCWDNRYESLSLPIDYGVYKLTILWSCQGGLWCEPLWLLVHCGVCKLIILWSCQGGSPASYGPSPHSTTDTKIQMGCFIHCCDKLPRKSKFRYHIPTVRSSTDGHIGSLTNVTRAAMNMDVGHTQKDRAGGRSLTGKRVSAEKLV